MTLSELLGEQGSLANVIQLEWFGTPSRGMPSGFEELGMFLMAVHNDS